MIYIALYIGSVVAINFAFSARPDLHLLWAAWVGLVFVARDMVQTRIGHWSLVAMAVALLLSYLTSSPFVALASAVAFALSETTDWAVFTITRRPLRDRLWISTALSVPVDTAAFLLMVGVFDAATWATAIASKMVGVTVLWVGLRARQAATA